MDVFARYSNAFHGVLGSGFGRILPAVDHLLWVFLVISVFMLAVTEAFGRTEFIPALFRWILGVGFAIFVIGDLQNIASMVLESMVQLGLRGGGSSMSATEFLRSPDALLMVGLEKWHELHVLGTAACEVNAWGCVGNLQGFLPLFIAGIIVMAAFVVIALMVFATTLLFKLATLASMILLPFLVFRATAPIGQKALIGMLYFGLQLLVLALITSVGSSVFSALAVGAEPTWESSLDVTVGALVLLGLVFGAGRLTHAIIMGGALQGASVVGTPAAASVIAARSAATHAAGGARAVAAGGGGALQAIRAASSHGIESIRIKRPQ